LASTIRQRINNLLDLSKITIDDRTRNKWREVAGTSEEITPEQTDREILEYFSSPAEVMERMAQLKNYFGMSGEEEFTKEHLAYAKEYYLKDTGLGMQMKLFLDGITPEKEDEFLELINSLGI